MKTIDEKDKIISLIFYEASSEDSSPADDRKLSRLYKQTQLTRTAWTAAKALLLDLDTGRQNDVENAVISLADAFEQQGFINGFRIGMMLRDEVDMSNLDTKKERN